MHEEDLCPEYTDIDGYYFECELPPDHEGEHEAVLRWPRREPAAPAEPNATNLALQRIWGAEILAHLNRGPFIHNTKPEDPEALTITFTNYFNAGDGEE